MTRQPWRFVTAGKGAFIRFTFVFVFFPRVANRIYICASHLRGPGFECVQRPASVVLNVLSKCCNSSLNQALFPFHNNRFISHANVSAVETASLN